jgi:hypothetical protein
VVNDTRSESEIKAAVRLRLSRCGIVIWNSPTASATLDSGRRMRLGLCRGASDLIGIRKQDGKMVAVETKTVAKLRAHQLNLARAILKVTKSVLLTKDEQHALEQANFIELVNACNGIAGFVTNEGEAEELVK